MLDAENLIRRRREPRHELPIGNCHPIESNLYQLRDVSESGARLHGKNAPPIGSSDSFLVNANGRAARLDGKVVWRNEDDFGVALAFCDETLQLLIEESTCHKALAEGQPSVLVLSKGLAVQREARRYCSETGRTMKVVATPLCAIGEIDAPWSRIDVVFVGANEHGFEFAKFLPELGKKIHRIMVFERRNPLCLRARQEGVIDELSKCERGSKRSGKPQKKPYSISRRRQRIRTDHLPLDFDILDSRFTPKAVNDFYHLGLRKRSA